MPLVPGGPWQPCLLTVSEGRGADPRTRQGRVLETHEAGFGG